MGSFNGILQWDPSMGSFNGILQWDPSMGSFVNLIIYGGIYLMKRIVLVAALCSALSSVIVPVTANALPVGGGWGTVRDKVVGALVTEGNLGEGGRAILEKIVVPSRKNLFEYKDKAFEIQERYRSIISALGLRVSCGLLNPDRYSGQRWMSCEFK
ncbi:hypothetical protein [Bartonella bacilliformis]|nr:hypothetical protein [Bartonella bacilliformis]ABM44902.1 conserved hypothetical protein [Bartonella bacilliformis KC583]EKS45891.1 hypothetical protein BbINS_01221 [Bartonella bacilliformis INS]